MTRSRSERLCESQPGLVGTGAAEPRAVGLRVGNWQRRGWASTVKARRRGGQELGLAAALRSAFHSRARGPSSWAGGSGVSWAGAAQHALPADALGQALNDQIS